MIKNYLLLLPALIALSDTGNAMSPPMPAAAIALTTSGKVHTCITLAESASPSEKSAAAELAAYLKKVTGAEFEILIPEQAAGRPAIAVGPGASKTLAPGLDLSKLGNSGLGEDGIVMKSAPPHLILTGAEGSARGTLYAVYEFLEREVGVRWWTTTEEFVPRAPTLAIRPLDVRYKPPFSSRELFTWGMVHEEKQWAYDGSDAAVKDWGKARFAARLRNNGHATSLPESLGGVSMPIGWVHTFYTFLPPEKYFKDHPEWYSEIDGQRTTVGPRNFHAQLCMTNEAMLAELSKVVLEAVRKQPQFGMISVSQNDGWGNCQCAKCVELDTVGGSPSASLLYGINKVADAVAAEFPGFKVETLAYLYSRKPPTKIIPRPNVIVRLAIIERYAAQPIDSDANRTIMNELKGWSSVASDLFLWDYCTNTYTPMAPNPVWQVFAPDLRTYRDHHVSSVFMEGEAIGVSDFVDLKTYLLAHLLWDPSRDEDKIIEEFLSGYYGKAGPALRQVLASYEEQARAVKFGMWYGTRNARWIALSTVNRATELFQKAEIAVKDDPILLGRLKRARISLEHQWLRNYAYYREQAKQQGAVFLGPKDPALAAMDFATHVRSEIAAMPADERFAWILPMFMSIRFDAYLDQLTEINAVATKTGPLPSGFREIPRNQIIDFEESLATVSKAAGAEIVSDANAANGLAMLVTPPKPKDGPPVPEVSANTIVGVASEPPDSTDRQVQVKTSDFASLGGFGRYHIYAVVRSEVQLPDGSFDAIVQDDKKSRSLGKVSFRFSPLVPEKSTGQTRPMASDGEYHVYDLGTYDLPHESVSVILSPVKGNIYVDRFIFVREPAPVIEAIQPDARNAASQAPKATMSADAVVLLSSSFDNLGPWTASDPKLYEINDGSLMMINGSKDAPLAVKFTMKPGTPVSVALDFRTAADNTYGHEFVMSLKDSTSGKGYSIRGCGKPDHFGQPGAESGFAYGPYGVSASGGEPGAALPVSASAEPRRLVLTFDPATQLVTLTQDDEVVVSFTGTQNLKQVDTFDLQLSSFEGGPVRIVDDVVISGTRVR